MGGASVLAGWLQADDVPAFFCEHAALGGSLQVAFLDEEGLVDFFQGVGLFADGDGHGAEADGATPVVFGYDAHHLLIHFIEAALVDFEEFKCGGGAGLVDRSIAALLGVVSAEVDQVVGDPRSAPRAAGDLGRPSRFKSDIEQAARPFDNALQDGVVVVVEPRLQG